VDIYSIGGQRIKYYADVKSELASITMDDINRGTYFIWITLKDGSRSVHKVIKK
jgi:hypothetical protein